MSYAKWSKEASSVTKRVIAEKIALGNAISIPAMPVQILEQMLQGQQAMLAKQAKNSKEKKMCYDCGVYENPEQEKRAYLRDRVFGIGSRIIHTLRKQFGLYDDDAPQTPAEVVKRIQDGQFVLNEAKDKYVRFFDNVRWRDPDLKEDQEGCRKAEVALEKAQQDVLDTVAIEDLDKALKAVQKLEDWKYKS